jgi:hypothetical protein
MSHHWSLTSILISIILCHLSYTHSTPINHAINGNADEYQLAYNTFINSMKTILDESSSYERIKLVNQLREHLNRMCVMGHFGPTHADACRHIVDVIHQTNAHNHVNDDENSDKSSEPHGIQKRFFCNGFIGCKSVSG